MQHQRVVITGAGGMLGRELTSACEASHVAATAFAGRRELDIADETAVRRVLHDLSPDLVINAAAFTDVDGAEADPDAAERANRAGPSVLGRTCRDASAALVHFSTDYIFADGLTRPLHIDDPAGPINTYGRSKLAGEREIIESGCEHLILRTSWLFAPHGRNFVRTILSRASTRAEIAVVNDQRGRPTYAPDLALLTLGLLGRRARGVYHATNSGECTWFEFAVAAVEMSGLPCRVTPCSSAEFPRPAPRPAYSVLDISQTQVTGVPIRHWRSALRQCVSALVGESTRSATSPRVG